MATSISLSIIAPSPAGSSCRPVPTTTTNGLYNRNRTTWKCATSRNDTTMNCSQRRSQQCTSGVKNKTALGERVESEKKKPFCSPGQFQLGSVKSTHNQEIYQNNIHSLPHSHSASKTSRKRTSKQCKTGKSSSPAVPKGGPALPSPKECPPSPHPVKLEISVLNETEQRGDTEMNSFPEKRRFSSIADSGRGDELSCSCGESDSQLQSSPYRKRESLNRCGNSHSDNCSDVEDDVFQDALSNLPSDDDCTSSTSSSAFVTPLSTRSQSPLFHLPNPDPKENFAHCLSDSLQKMKVERLTALPDFNGDVLTSLNLNDHVNMTVTTANSHDSGSILTSQVNTTSIKNKQKKRLNGLQRPQMKRVDQSSSSPIHCINELSLTTSAERKDKPRLAPSRNRKVNKTVYEGDDSGCSVGYGSGTSSSKAKKSRHTIPSHHKDKNNFEDISISSASPPSSVCSHSPVTLSPSPTSSFSNQLTVKNSMNPSLQKFFSTNNDTINLDNNTQDNESKDEWPDLGMDFSTPSKPPSDKIHTHLELEAQFSESSPDSKTEDNDSGCNMSISSSVEFSLRSLKRSHQQPISPQQPQVDTTAPYPLVVDKLPPLPGRDPPQHQCVISPEHYLWLQSQQLNTFIQQHQEQQEKQTDKQLFYPVEPPPQHISVCPPEAMGIHCPLPVHPPHLHPRPPPPLPHMIPPHHPFPQLLHPPPPPSSRPLFFSPPHLHDSQFTPIIQPCLSDRFCPPPPPPPPPLPIQPYHQDILLTGNTSDSLCSLKKKDDNDRVHSLQDIWVMWYDRITGNHRSQSADYQASLKKLLSVTTVERFWQLYNNILQPHEIEQNSNYHFFKDGIKPLWEDPANREGGKWVFTIKNDCVNLTRSWLEVLLLLVGGSLERCNQINGAVVSRRKKGDRIALWTNTRKEKPNVDICTKLIRSLLIAYDTPLEDVRKFVIELSEGKNGLSLVFMHHKDSLKSGHSYQNDAHITLSDHLEVVLEDIQKVL